MPQTTAAPRKVRSRSEREQRAAAQAAFDAAAAAIGHPPGVRTAPDEQDGGTRTQYACGCGKYLSVLASYSAARLGWVSHARVYVTARARTVSVS